MSACPQCGTPARPADKFCNTCGTPVNRATSGPGTYPAPPPPVGAGYGGPPFGAPAPPGGQGGQGGQGGSLRCQVGHEIQPGQSYCPLGHPMALDAMQFTGDPYAQTSSPYDPTAYGGQVQQPPPLYAPPPPPAPQAPQAPPPPYAQQQSYPPAGPPNYGGAPPAPVASPGPLPLPPGARALRGFLVSFQINPVGEFWPLMSGRTTVGRANAGDPADLPLADPTISSRHAVLLVDTTTGAIQVEDTSSTNGTYVNEEHIGMNGKRDLRDGDRVRFGGYTTIVKCLGRIG